jgi:hypothetical protein
MKLARAVFAVAGLYGLITLVPTYFLASRIGLDDPPASTHPEFYYGFLGAALAWQLMFLVIAYDPMRYRPAMPVALIEKLAFGVAVVALYAAQRIHVQTLGMGMIDLLLGALFVVSYYLTPRALDHRASATPPARARDRLGAAPESGMPRI